MKARYSLWTVSEGPGNVSHVRSVVISHGPPVGHPALWFPSREPAGTPLLRWANTRGHYCYYGPPPASSRQDEEDNRSKHQSMSGCKMQRQNWLLWLANWEAFEAFFFFFFALSLLELAICQVPDTDSSQSHTLNQWGPPWADASSRGGGGEARAGLLGRRVGECVASCLQEVLHKHPGSKLPTCLEFKAFLFKNRLGQRSELHKRSYQRVDASPEFEVPAAEELAGLANVGFVCPSQPHSSTFVPSFPHSKSHII